MVFLLNHKTTFQDLLNYEFVPNSTLNRNTMSLFALLFKGWRKYLLVTQINVFQSKKENKFELPNLTKAESLI